MVTCGGAIRYQRSENSMKSSTMSIRLPLAPVQNSATYDDGFSESSSSDQDETWEDWVDDSPPKPCRSLFDDSEFPSVDQTIAYDKSTHGFDLGSAFTKMGEHSLPLATRSLTLLDDDSS